MSPRPRSTFAKRQKEQARLEKQRTKAQRKLQRKLENQATGEPTESAGEATESGAEPTESEDVSPAADHAPAPQMESH